MPRTIDDQLNTGLMRPIVVSVLESWGRDFTKCELCGKSIKKYNLHHTKYEGATIYDLKIVCQSCNLKGENRYLE